MLEIKFGNHGSLTGKPKTFSTGSIGFYAGGKVEIDGKRYQVSCNVIEIGSKPQPGETRTPSGAIVGEPTTDGQ
jgi:hypothetical protein